MAINSTSAVKHGHYCLPETSSRCVTRSTTAAHKFEVTNFSQLEGMGAGKFVSSSTFSVGGRDWKIRFYPDGSKPEYRDKGYVTASLNFVKGEIGGRVKFSMSLRLIDKGDDQVSLTMLRTIDSIDGNWGWGHYIKKSKLKELLQHPKQDDSFTIRCVLTVMDEPHIEDVTVIVPESKLHQDLSHMLKNGEGADVTFSVGGQLFPAHKCMLAARSMVFKAEFFGAMKERDDQCIKIEDMEPAIFEALLHFANTDSLPDAVADKTVAMQHLLVAADRYGLERLRLMCEAKLCRGIDAETFATTLALAEQHRCTLLKDACLAFVASGDDALGAVMKTDGFKHLVASCPFVAVEILDKIARAKSQ